MFAAVIRAVLLLAGTASILTAGIFTLGHMTDRTVFTILVPGFVVGLILIAAAVWGGRARAV
jgi:hypothetical protein